jgi:hypothetical protein
MILIKNLNFGFHLPAPSTFVLEVLKIMTFLLMFFNANYISEHQHSSHVLVADAGNTTQIQKIGHLINSAIAFS